MSIQENKLKAIADAIREKEGSTEPIPANDFSARILAIPTGGGLPDDVRTITLTADPPEGGTATGGGMVQEGITVTVKAAASDGYNFTGWQENGEAVSEDENYTFTVDGNVELVAVFEAGKVSRLPDGYTELKYISTNSGTSILTDIIVTTSTTKVVADITPQEVASSWYADIFAGRYNYFAFGLVSGDSSNKMAWSAGNLYNGEGTFTYSLKKDVRITVDMDTPEKTIKIGDSTFGIVPYSYNSGNQKLRFGWRTGNTSVAGLSMYIHSAQIYVDGELKGDFIPCKDEFGKAGLYNLITDTFCVNNSNAGSSEPDAGPAV